MNLDENEKQNNTNNLIYCCLDLAIFVYDNGFTCLQYNKNMTLRQQKLLTLKTYWNQHRDSNVLHWWQHEHTLFHRHSILVSYNSNTQLYDTSSCKTEEEK